MVYLVIGLIQILYVALNSFRLVLMVKGKKYLASMISTVEIFVYLSGLALVLKYLEQPLGIFIYCASYGIGILVGTFIENKIAIGYVTVQVISENGLELGSRIRETGFGVTTWIGEGVQGLRQIHYILAKRKDFQSLMSTIQEIDPKAFIVSYEPIHFKGGFMTKRLGPSR